MEFEIEYPLNGSVFNSQKPERKKKYAKPKRLKHISLCINSRSKFEITILGAFKPLWYNG